MLVSTACGATQNLQSSLNPDSGLGTTTLGCMFVGEMVSCIFAPFLIRTLEPKLVVLLGIFWHIAFMAANIYPAMYTLIPSALLLGLATGPFSTCQGYYITQLAMKYAEASTKAKDIVISKFNGIFFMLFQSGQIWGNLVSSIVLAKPDNITLKNDSYNFKVCGPNNCPWSNITETKLTSTKPDNNIVYLLFGIYIAISMLALGLALLFLRNIRTANNRNDCGHNKVLLSTVRHGLSSTFKTMKEFKTLLLIPMFLYNGFEQALIVGEFTKVCF